MVFEELLDATRRCHDVLADCALRSAEREASSAATGYRGHLHRIVTSKRPLNAREEEAKRKRSVVRARVEHVLAQQCDRMARTIGKARAEVKIGIRNVAYNMRRLAWLMG